MATPEELATGLSFINVFLADPSMKPYGTNALPLFALGLYLGVEDVISFAADSLTDHPDDKKADFIYVNEAEGVACIAQGSTAENWGKAEAPANKASDLNTAAAWLLVRPLEEVPEPIRAHAKLLRDGLQEGTITKVIFAYAHNAYESQNVQRELETVRQLVTGLQSTSEVEVAVVELGLRQIEALHLTALGSIQVGEEVELQGRPLLRETGQGWRAYVLSLKGSILYDLYERHKNALFSANLRDFLGTRKSLGNVNNKIKRTVETEPGNFFVFNNGITLVTKKAEVLKRSRLRISGVSIVNGAQTTGAIHAAGSKRAAQVSVLARIIVVDDQQMIPTIVAANNTQNAILAWDRRSNDPTQIRIRREFEERGVEYVHRRDYGRRSSSALFADQVGQMLCAFGGDLQTSIRAKADIFESDSTYSMVFPGAISIGHIFAVQTLGWAYDRFKYELKQKSAAGAMSGLEEKQLRLLDYPASKQFLIRVMGDLREEIAGRRVEKPQSFEIKVEHIGNDTERVIAGWLKVIKSILPTIVQSLRAEEYQVVRSSDLTREVSDRTKGIVAGAEEVQSNFRDLRGVLKPQ